MKDFCNGVIWGVLIGTCAGAILVAKNKKLSSKIKEGLDITEDKIKETKQAIEEKLNQENCCSGYEFCDDDCDMMSKDIERTKSRDNNFSKKNKNC